MQKGPRIYVVDSDDGLDAFSPEIEMPARRAAPASRTDSDPLEEFEIQRPPVELGLPPEPATSDWVPQEPAADGRRLLVVGVIGFALTVGVLTLLVGPIWTRAPAQQAASASTAAQAAAAAAPPAAPAPDTAAPVGTGALVLGPENAALPPLEEPAPPAPAVAAAPRIPVAPAVASPRAVAPTLPAETPARPLAAPPIVATPAPAPSRAASPPTGSAAPVGSPTAFGVTPPAAVAVPPRPEPEPVTPPAPAPSANAPPRAAPAESPTSAAGAPTAAPGAVPPGAVVPSAVPPSAVAAAPRDAAPALSPIEVESAAIQNVLGRYRTAFNRLDVVGATTVWPGVDQGNLARAFDQLEQQQVTFDDCLIEIKGAAAQAACRGTARYVPRVGSRTPRTDRREWTFSLRKGDAGWLINGVTAR